MRHRAPLGQLHHEVSGDRRPDSATRLTLDDYLDEQEAESFPASDAHSDWAGPPTWTQHTKDEAKEEESPISPGEGVDRQGGVNRAAIRPRR